MSGTYRVALPVLCTWFFSCDERTIAPPPGDYDALVAFGVVVSNVNGKIYSEMWTGEADGRLRKVSLNPACFNKDPDVSSDGQRVVFCSCELASTEGNDIFIADADGNGLRNVTNDKAVDESPRWSPDGKHIAFQSFRNGQRDVYILDSTNSAATKLSSSKGSSWLGDWSPDGTSVVYYAFMPDSVGKEWQIFVVPVAGSPGLQLTSGPGIKMFPTWSPACSTIAYVQDGQLHVMSSDGMGDRKLDAQVDSVTSPPCWSSDGRKMFFEGVRQGRSDVYSISEDGTGLLNLTEGYSSGSNPAVSPVGDAIAYVARLGIQSRIYLMNVNGSEKRPLTQFNVTEEFQPVWKRRPGKNCL